MVTTLEEGEWVLVSAVQRHQANPDTFKIPSEARRSNLQRGEAAKLLFDIETRGNGTVIDRGVDKMWVIVIAIQDDRYRGILDSDPGKAVGLNLSKGDLINFDPSHICDIAQPPRDFLEAVHCEYFS
ncbi:hypothetical protein [Planktotalea sp.]|uniref:hypothetical protein n=1 Tax=Planktotalea sp. TaxID=2029877 RepID=UPI00329830F3